MPAKQMVMAKLIAVLNQRWCRQKAIRCSESSVTHAFMDAVPKRDELKKTKKTQNSLECKASLRTFL